MKKYYIVLNALTKQLTGVEQQAIDLFKMLDKSNKVKPYLVTIDFNDDVDGVLQENGIPKSRLINFYDSMALNTKTIIKRPLEIKRTYDKNHRLVTEFYKTKSNAMFSRLLLWDDNQMFPKEVFMQVNGGSSLVFKDKEEALTYFFKTFLSKNSEIELFSITKSMFKGLKKAFKDKINLNYPTAYDHSDTLNAFIKDNIRSIGKIYVESRVNKMKLDLFLGENASKIVNRYVIPHLKGDDFSTSEHLNFVYVGDFRHNKGQLDVIKALNMLKNKYKITNFTLYLVGHVVDLPYFNTISDYLKENPSIKEHIEMTVDDYSNQKDRFYLYKGKTYFLSASKHEGFGRVYLESLFYNIPIIALANHVYGLQDLILTSLLNNNAISLFGNQDGDSLSLKELESFVDLIYKTITLDYSGLKEDAQKVYLDYLAKSDELFDEFLKKINKDPLQEKDTRYTLYTESISKLSFKDSKLKIEVGDPFLELPSVDGTVLISYQGDLL